jgi:hypothetical protein
MKEKISYESCAELARVIRFVLKENNVNKCGEGLEIAIPTDCQRIKIELHITGVDGKFKDLILCLVLFEPKRIIRVFSLLSALNKQAVASLRNLAKAIDFEFDEVMEEDNDLIRRILHEAFGKKREEEK